LKRWALSLGILAAILTVGVCVSTGVVFAAEAEPAPPPVPDVPDVAPPGGEDAPPAEAKAPAGEAPPAEGEAPPAKKRTVLETINAGGVIGYIIIGLSFVALSLIIEHAVSLRREKLCPDELAQELEDYFNQEQYEEALELCNVERNLLTDVVRAGLSRIDSGYERMQEAMQEAGEESSVQLQQKISYLSLIGNISPMLGLLGTVSGMVGAFGKIAQMTNVKPAVLAGNINEALVTTLLGLTVAIPVMCAFQFFSNRVTRIVLEASTMVSDMMERFKPAK
jgi:biopolymer transport protein ExbB